MEIQVRRAIIFVFSIIVCSGLTGCLDTGMNLDVTPSAVIHYFQQEGQTETIVDAGAHFTIEYTWKVGEDFEPPKRHLRVFVHFVDSSGNIIIGKNGSTVQDDHEPPIPVSEWKPGQDIVYTRSRVVFPAELGSRGTEVKMLIGLFDPETNERARLVFPTEKEPKNKAYHVATLRVRKNNYILPIFNETWHGPEPGAETVSRWTKKESVVVFNRDPWAEAADLWISGHSPIEDLDPSITVQTMSIYIHDKKPEFLITEEPLKFVRPGSDMLGEDLVFVGESLPPTRLPIPQNLFETYSDQPIRFIIEVNAFLTPGGTDNRQQLGFLFKTLNLVPKNRQR